MAFYSIDGYKLSVQLLGEGGDPIVLLHGFGVLSPILEYRALAGLLAQRHQVLVVELFGYGFSDCVPMERTVERITAELHAVIAPLRRPCILMGHSISGVYALCYANRYPGEVRAFVGIDSSVPKQNDVLNVMPLNLLVLRTMRALRKTGLLDILARKRARYLPDIDSVDWSPDEVELFRRLYCENMANDTVLHELQSATGNFMLARELKFPEAIPVLCFLSRQTCNRVKGWEHLHREIIRERATSKILICEGGHFLHYSHPWLIADETCAWLSSIPA